MTQGATTRSYTTLATSNRLTNLSNPAVTFTHDAAGNTLTGNTTAVAYTSTYNLEGRLATNVVGTITHTYSIDTAGQRVRKYASNAASTTVIFVYNLQGQLLGEYNSSGTALREYVWLGNEPIAIFTPNGANPPNIFYIHNDHLGTPRAVQNKAAQLRWRWMAEPFGTSAAETNPQSLGAFTFNLRHPGQYADTETGLFYNWHRDYDAGIGRYVQSDPIGLAGGINTYSYVGANPLSYADPSGLINLNIPGAAGENTIHANPGPGVVPPGARAEHLPAHVHLGSNSGPRINTETFEPLTEADARRMSNSQKKFCKRMADDIKDMVRRRQNSVFRYGRVMAGLLAAPAIALDSYTAACRQDIFWCAENTPDAFDIVIEKICKANQCPEN